MNNNMAPLTEVTSANVLSIIRELLENAERNERLLEQVLAILEQSELRKDAEQFDLPAWSPSEGFGHEFELNGLNPRIRRVEVLQGKSQDTVARLKSTWLGQFYIKHLKQYAFFRWLASSTWRNAYPIYVNYIATHLHNKKARRWRPLTKLSELVRKHGLQSSILADAMLVETPEPHVVPRHDQGYLDSQQESYNFPEIYVAKVSHGLIYGGTNLVLTENGVICHDMYDFDRDYTSEELHGRTLIEPKSGRIRWLLHDDEPEQLPAAAAFVDACAGNYAHWMTEVLTRIAAFCAEEKFKGIPIVVNDGLHKNIMESLSLVAGPDREIITLPIGRAIRAESLYLMSVCGYVPFDQRNKKLTGHSHGKFNPRAFELIRSHIGAFADDLPMQVWPKKIYLRRNSGTRKVTNAAELEDILVAQGYSIVEPEKFTFLQQVQLFRNAHEVIAPTGASLANAIFCQPGTHVGILMAKHEQMIYRYWLSMLAPLQVNVSYVLGDIVENHDNGIHADFHVDRLHVLDLLQAWQHS